MANRSSSSPERGLRSDHSLPSSRISDGNVRDPIRDVADPLLGSRSEPDPEGLSPGAGRRDFDWTGPLSLAFVLILAALVLLPMLWLVVASLRDDAGHFSFENYRQFFTDASFLKPLFTTLWTSTAVGVICLVVAAPMAWLVSRTDLPGK